MSNQEAIGLIDSGVGGLTVLKEALKQLPNERLIYLEIQPVAHIFTTSRTSRSVYLGNGRFFIEKTNKNASNRM